jgi:hypothetical protein
VNAEPHATRKAIPMRKTRRVYWTAAGLLLAASPALAQEVRQGVQPARADVETLPAPRASVTPMPAAPALVAPAQVAPAQVLPAQVVPATGPACASGAAAGDWKSSWHLWRAEKHADCQAHMWGYPSEFSAPPLGAVIHAHFRTMVANGEAASMVLYRCDFIDGKEMLNLRGRDELTRMAAMLGTNNCPIVIERTPEVPALAEARRMAVLNVFALNGIPIPPERIVIGPSIAHGLSGTDAEFLYRYSFRNMAVQATPVPIPTGGAGVGTQGGGGGLGGIGGGR